MAQARNHLLAGQSIIPQWNHRNNDKKALKSHLLELDLISTGHRGFLQSSSFCLHSITTTFSDGGGHLRRVSDCDFLGYDQDF